LGSAFGRRDGLRVDVERDSAVGVPLAVSTSPRMCARKMIPQFSPGSSSEAQRLPDRDHPLTA